MKILIACEESQAVCKEFRKLGHEAYSCDILPCSGGEPQWHIQRNVLNCLGKLPQNNMKGWDMMIAHPPCTYLTKAGCRWLYPKGVLNEERYKKGLEAKEFFFKLLNANISMIAIENPKPQKIFNMPKESQIIQPCEFGHKLKKTTFLWLKNLPLLKPTKVVEPEYYIDGKGIRHTKLISWSAKKSSKTFEGIARAMAEQWSSQVTVSTTGEEK